MLDISFILENKELVQKAITDKHTTAVDLEALELLYRERNVLTQQLSELNHQRNIAASERAMDRGAELKQQAVTIEEKLRELTAQLTETMAKIPNVPLPDVPIGADEEDNVLLREWGEKPQFSFQPKPHWELGLQRGFIDNERAAKVAGSRFTFLKGEIVTLQFAIINWVLATVTDEALLKEVIERNNLQVPSTPFIPVLPPVMITPEMFFGMARLDPKEERYYLKEDNLFLIGSAEHTLGAMHASERFTEQELPKRYIGYSTAFRREAGSYGRDTKGILRQHQFDKLEFECFTVGEKSKEEQDFLVALQEHLTQQLELPYRVVAVCTGDMGGPDLRQIDLEMWMPGQNTYRETHSADLMGEYQARRLGIKVKRESGENEFVHMNDATVFALGRLIIAILENNQDAEGTIRIPEVLRPYLGGRKTL